MSQMNRRTLLAALAAFLIPAAATAQSGLDARDLTRISNYLNGVETMRGSFVQVGPDGDLSDGRFYMRRPGRIRFEYVPPNPGLVVADGTWVGVYDIELCTLDRVPLGETPLDILLKDRVDLRREDAVSSIERAEGQLRVTAVDPDDPASGSITMIFSDTPLELRQWIVTDAQGLLTTVALSETVVNVSLDPNLFRIEEDCQAAVRNGN